MASTFEFINTLEIIANSVKDFIPKNILIVDGELPPDLEMYIGNDFTQKFNNFLKDSLSEDDYSKIELGLSESDETEWYLKYHDISENILKNIDGISEKATVFSNQYLRDLNYVDLTEKFSMSKGVDASIGEDVALTFEEILVSDSEPIVSNPELDTVVAKPLSTTLYMSDDDEDESEYSAPIVNVPSIDSIIASPIQKEEVTSIVVEKSIEDTKEVKGDEIIDFDAIRKSHGIGEEIVENPLSKEPIIDSVITPLSTIKKVSGMDGVNIPQSKPISSAMPNLDLGKVKNIFNGLNMSGLSILLNKKIMIGLFIILLVGGTVLYQKQQTSGIDGVRNSTKSLTEQLNSKPSKPTISSLQGSETLEYIIFKSDISRDSSSDSQRVLSNKTVDELNTFLTTSLTKLKTTPDNLQIFANMSIRIFSVDGKKIVIDTTVREFVLKRMKK